MNQNNGIDITKMSLNELKALAYDLLVQVEGVQKNLNIINAQIAKKTEEEKNINVQPAVEQPNKKDK